MLCFQEAMLPPEKETTMPKTDDIRQTTLRVPKVVLQKAKFYLDQDDSNINEFCVKHLEQYVQKWEKRAAVTQAEDRETAKAS
jgi:hypothetical protein